MLKGLKENMQVGLDISVTQYNPFEQPTGSFFVTEYFGIFHTLGFPESADFGGIISG